MITEDRFTVGAWTLVDGRWLLRVAGGSPEGDPPKDPPPPEPKAGDPPNDPPKDPPKDPPEPDPDPDAGLAKVPESELQRLKRIAAEYDKQKRAAEREAKQKAEQEKRDEGKVDEILRERDERIVELENELAARDYLIQKEAQMKRVSAVGRRLSFRDPDDLARYLSDDEMESERTVENAAKRLLREKPYLKAEARQSGAAINGDGQGGLSIEQLKSMSPDQINANWDAVSKALETQRQ